MILGWLVVRFLGYVASELTFLPVIETIQYDRWSSTWIPYESTYSFTLYYTQ